MLDEQVEAYAALDRMRLMVLGLLGTGAKVEALLAIPRDDGERAAPGPIADFLLGLVSMHRTLRANLSTADAVGGKRAAADAPDSPPRILR